METEILSSLAGGGSVAILAFIIFWFYRQDKKEQIEKERIEKQEQLTHMQEEKEAEIARWQDQIDKYETINKELISCREADNKSREDLANNLGQLAEAIRSCGLRDNHRSSQ